VETIRLNVNAIGLPSEGVTVVTQVDRTKVRPDQGAYTVAYADLHGVVALDDGNGRITWWWFKSDSDHLLWINSYAVYAPNAADSPQDAIEPGKATIPYDASLRAYV
jgi:hypothetical protein